MARSGFLTGSQDEGGEKCAEPVSKPALAFNDQYDTDARFELSGAFHEALSVLGEQLALRIELEDKLLKILS